MTVEENRPNTIMADRYQAAASTAKMKTDSSVSAASAAITVGSSAYSRAWTRRFSSSIPVRNGSPAEISEPSEITLTSRSDRISLM